MNSRNAAIPRPLAGVRVLELSQIMAGPSCGLMLADMGADVVKVERFPGGDDARGYRRPGDSGLAPSFLMLNRGKRSVALDIRQAAGRQALLQMVLQADVLTENFRPGVMERLGLGPAALAEVNPALVYCSISGYGPTGPLAGKGGFDLIAQAFAGLISVTGEPGRAPVKPGNSVADINAGLLAAFGVLAAYVQRLKTGCGSHVQTSLLQAAMQQTYWFAAAYFSQGIVAKPMGTAHPLIAPYQTFECADGAIALGGANQANWERIAQVLGHAEWLQDARFASAAERLRNRVELAALMTGELRRRPVAEWLACFDAAGVPAGPVNDIGQALEHEQARAVGMVVDAAHPDGGTTRALGSPVQVGPTAFAALSPAPRVGEHTRELLLEAGLSRADVDALLHAGIAFQLEHKAPASPAP
ncbi:MAG: CoA transferase [Burkholderiaceae bacterium]